MVAATLTLDSTFYASRTSVSSSHEATYSTEGTKSWAHYGEMVHIAWATCSAFASSSAIED